MANKSFIVEYIIRARDKFTASTDKLHRSTEKMRKSINKAKRDVATFAARSKAKLASFAASAKKSFNEVSASARRGGAILTATVTAPILLMANSFKNAARDAVETRSKFATVYKDIGNESELAADRLAKNFGLAGTKSRELLGDTGDLLSGFGFTGKAALDMSVKVNELAVDLASFTNFSGGAEGASAALTKALLGERESLKTLGIAILEKDVKAKVSMMIANGATFASMRQAKAAATLALAMDQSKNAIGDYARTSEDLANQERLTASRIQDLKESFGKILMPAAMNLTQSIRSMVKWLTSLSPAAKKMILVIAGIVAVIGPLLLILGSVALAMPLIVAGFAAIATGIAFAGTAILSVIGIIKALSAVMLLNPIGLMLTLMATAAFLIMKNWKPIKLFFINLWDGIAVKAQEMYAKIKPIIDAVIAFKNLVAGGIESAKSAAFEALGGEDGVLGGRIMLPELNTVGQESRVDVGVNVGLDQGLTQASKPTVNSTNTRRADVGFAY